MKAAAERALGEPVDLPIVVGVDGSEPSGPPTRQPCAGHRSGWCTPRSGSVTRVRPWPMTSVSRRRR